MSRHLLAAHLRRPTPETTRKLRAFLNSEVTAVLRGHPAKSRPDWVSASELRTVAGMALDDAIGNLPESITYDDVSDYVQQQIEKAVKETIRKPEDVFTLDRPHAIRRGSRSSGSVVAIVDDIDDLVDHPDYRDRVSAELSKMFPKARTKTEKTVLALFEARAPLARIRAQTKLRGPDVARILSELRHR